MGPVGGRGGHLADKQKLEEAVRAGWQATRMMVSCPLLLQEFT